MKKIRDILILWLLFSLMQCGPVVGTLEYGEAGGPMETLWLMVPFSLLCLLLLIFTIHYAIPRLLIHREWGYYAAWEFGLSYVISFIEQLVIVYIWQRWEIIPPEHKLNWTWLMVNAFCNSLMLFFTLLAVGGWYLFDSMRCDLKKEQILADRIGSYMAAVKRLLRPETLSIRLGEIADKVEKSPLEAEKDINQLAAELRESLYNLPVPPAVDKEMTIRDDENSKFNLLLTSRRYHVARVIIFQLSLVLICFGAFFATPDQPEFRSRFGGFLVLLAMFEIIAAFDIFVFFRSFRKRRNRGRFIMASVVLAVVMILPILAERVMLYLMKDPGNELLFVITTVLAASASILMIGFYIAGIGAMLLYQDWVRHVRRLISLQASTKRLEYANLKKQINPHFLFNILNSASMLTMFDASDARDILLELRRLIDYQFSETERPSVPLDETVSFLRAYLMLEATRRNSFGFEIKCENDSKEVEVPSLLFIPFVENAVKYANPRAEGDLVKIKFEIKGSRLTFECENPVEDKSQTAAPESSSRSHSPEAGGLGIANTLRRLDLLYDENFSYSAHSSGGTYRVILDIPLSGKDLSEI